MTKIELLDQVNSAPSGGTLATVFNGIPPRKYQPKHLKFQPLLRLPNGSKSAYATKNCNQRVLGLHTAFGAQHWTTMFVMADVMKAAVTRSNALNGYGQVEYVERQQAPSFATAVGRYLTLLGLLAVIGLPEFIRFRLLPAPGDGPSKETMDKGFLQVSAKATGDKGSQVGCRLYFNTDPGYRDTARMLVESGLAIALSPERMLAKGGVLTPASCQGPVLLERLCATGCEFQILSAL